MKILPFLVAATAIIVEAKIPKRDVRGFRRHDFGAHNYGRMIHGGHDIGKQIREGSASDALFTNDHFARGSRGDGHRHHEEVKSITIHKEVKVPYPVTVEKKVPYPVKVFVNRPVPVRVPKPYPVHVTKTVPYPVKQYIRVPYRVEKKIPYPVKVPVVRSYPVHIPKPYPVYVVKKVPYPVLKKVPYPVKVPVFRPVPQRVPEKRHVEKRVSIPVEEPASYDVENPYPVYVEVRVPCSVVMAPRKVEELPYIANLPVDTPEPIQDLQESQVCGVYFPVGHQGLQQGFVLFQNPTAKDFR